jgi:hypothetical protein
MPSTTLLTAAGYGSFIVAIKHAVSIEQNINIQTVIAKGNTFFLLAYWKTIPKTTPVPGTAKHCVHMQHGWLVPRKRLSYPNRYYTLSLENLYHSDIYNLEGSLISTGRRTLNRWGIR